MMVRIFLLSIFGFLFLNGLAQNKFSNAVSELLKKPEYKNASVGMQVVELESQKEIFNLNASQLLVPASTIKLITTATALELLGDDYQFRTIIGYEGNINKQGELKGDLVLKGGADPALGSEYFQDHYFRFLQSWVQKISDAGIKRVNGNLVLDASVYDSEKVPATWIWEDLGNYYGAGADAFTVYDNMFRITFRSPKEIGAPTQVIMTHPKVPGIEFSNEVVSSEVNRDNAYVFGSPLDKNRVIRGSIPANRKAFTIRASMPDPSGVLANDLTLALAEAGIFIEGKVEFRKADDKHFQKIYMQLSPKLSDIVEVLNHESVNLFSEHLLKQLAVEKNGLGNREAGIDIVTDFWKKQGLDTESLLMEDGSGLSHFNVVSPHFFIELLTFMADNKSFVASLPSPGNGTMYLFDKNLFPDHSLQAKSGSMTRVRCYSGYLVADSGKKMVFSIMFNHFHGSHFSLVKEIEKLLLTLKQEN
ncbi:D-alanyl-D-alanine carboxypeptidase/D-alanyl-D-alanine-endopeptidase [Maribellus sp. CM-23]|uniref:D-alanyl-D-alanine carboxypeptidase/D-alanyl-D-alanine endopeptidase n=1 Tax=Maribellus sp. CM-23 TaxID=2781026 RepID=UPI001F394882|nr:D-alanyl-D-alanine carboxypeptidase/D-alanyl-D-alanine-endopeptidase [Maribellus sp. CM-23]MCE4564246.1 D-alanyl-D-alanine carboxypeptidase/D-alanyl-D-alanine-endopeptidase [Maribellus sp. CM-23]